MGNAQRRGWRWLAALCMAGAATAPALAQYTVKVGVVGPFSGPSATTGRHMLHGIQLAVEQINARGGYMGRTLELVVRDNRGQPELGRKVAQDIVAEGVVATIGFCSTGVAMKALAVFQQARIPLLVPCSTGRSVTSTYPAASSYIFRIAAPDNTQAPFVVEDILSRGWSRVALFADNSPDGQAGRKEIETALAAHYLKPVFVGSLSASPRDVRAQLTSARDAQPHVIVSAGQSAHSAALAQGREELGWKVPQVGAWPMSQAFQVREANDAAEGTLAAQTFIAEPSNDRRTMFLNAYVNKFGNLPTEPMPAAQAYDATYLLMYALLSIGDKRLDGPALKHALENIERIYYGVVSIYERPFSANNKDAIKPQMLMMGKLQNGTMTFADPKDAKRNLLEQRSK